MTPEELLEVSVLHQLEQDEVRHVDGDDTQQLHHVLGVKLPEGEEFIINDWSAAPSARLNDGRRPLA